MIIVMALNVLRKAKAKPIRTRACSLCFSTTSGIAGRPLFFVPGDHISPYISRAWKTVVQIAELIGTDHRYVH